MNSDVYIIQNDDAKYPTENFNPDERYPEYPFQNEDVSKSTNHSYNMIRKLLKESGYDKENFGTSNWNPLGTFIQPGMNVVIKPNWVNNQNLNKSLKNKKNEMDCLITHTSILRAICDYCVIALKGMGKITICDAPVQECKLDVLWEKAKVYNLIDFYKKYKVDVSCEDLRAEQRVFNCFAVKTETKQLGGKDVFVKMNELTAFKELKNKVYNIPNYDYSLTKKYQHGNTHIYSISQTILTSDVIINVCKPKCHRYAGITASLKNSVGMVSHKETIPHRRFGAIEDGGDSYSKRSKIKKMVDRTLIKQTKLENKNHPLLATLCRFEYGFLFYLCKLVNEDSSLKGAWHGNDTIWRTILDLNYIIRYANKKGELQKSEQRKILNIGDMIVAGQHNGPMAPEPKKLGLLLMSEDAAAFDFTVAKIMGFKYDLMPLFRNIAEGNTWIKQNKIFIHTNITNLNGEINKLNFPKSWHFIPHDGWKDVFL